MARTETDITVEQAREILTAPGYDAYGTHRIYFTYAASSQYAGQIGSVKSVQQLDGKLGPVQEGFDRLYLVGYPGGIEDFMAEYVTVSKVP